MKTKKKQKTHSSPRVISLVLYQKRFIYAFMYSALLN